MKKSVSLLLIILSAAILIVSGFLVSGFTSDRSQDKAIEKQILLKKMIPEENTDVPKIDFTELRRINPDIVAWLTIEDTQVDYPIVQAPDNEYYLRRDFEKKKNKNGTLFLDYRNHSDFSDYNNIIYGHNMHTGLMFKTINSFKEKTFWDTHTSAWLYLPEQTYKLEIFSVIRIPDDSPLYKYSFASPDEKAEFDALAKRNAIFSREVERSEEDRLVMLSTCSYEFKNARTVLLAKMLPAE